MEQALALERGLRSSDSASATEELSRAQKMAAEREAALTSRRAACPVAMCGWAIVPSPSPCFFPDLLCCHTHTHTHSSSVGTLDFLILFCSLIIS